MKVSIICENCNTINELYPIDNEMRVSVERLNNFHVEDVEIDRSVLNMEELNDLEEVDDISPKINHIRIDCKNCDEFILLKDFSNNIYSYE